MIVFIKFGTFQPWLLQIFFFCYNVSLHFSWDSSFTYFRLLDFFKIWFSFFFFPGFFFFILSIDLSSITFFVCPVCDHLVDFYIFDIVFFISRTFMWFFFMVCISLVRAPVRSLLMSHFSLESLTIFTKFC